MEELGEFYKTGAHLLVEPEEIEPKLKKIWESLAHENKTRASLFNLIIYTKLNARTDYFRSIVQKVIETYPCRTLFITSDPDLKNDYLKTAISVLSPKDEPHIACDQIDIGVAGKAYYKLFFLLLPHFIPDLPIYLLWAEDPDFENPLFRELQKISSKILFDSESTSDMSVFAKSLLSIEKPLSDLNWTRLEPWRLCFASQFSSEERLSELKKVETITLRYHAKPSDFFSHLQIQSLYFIHWLASRLQWKGGQRKGDTLYFEGEKKISIVLIPDEREELTPGSICSCNISSGANTFEFIRDKKIPSLMKIHICSQERCDSPIQFHFGKDIRGLSLSKELIAKGTDRHYLEMLQSLSELSQ